MKETSDLRDWRGKSTAGGSWQVLGPLSRTTYIASTRRLRA